MLRHKIKSLVDIKKQQVAKVLSRTSKGITLAELVIVVIIIGFILLGLVRGLGGNIDKTKQTTHQNIVSSIDSAATEASVYTELTAGTGSDAPGLADVNAETIAEPTGGNEDHVLLNIIDKNHPLVKQGLITKVPQNPFANKFPDYRYVIDFKVVTQKMVNADGTTGDDVKVIPVVKLAHVSEAGVIDRNNFLVIDGGTVKPNKDAAASNVLEDSIYKFNFKEGTAYKKADGTLDVIEAATATKK